MFGVFRLSHLALIASLGLSMSCFCALAIVARGGGIQAEGEGNALVMGLLFFNLLGVSGLFPLAHLLWRDMPKLQAYVIASRGSVLQIPDDFRSKDVKELALQIYEVTFKNRSPLRSVSEPAPLVSSESVSSATIEKRALREIVDGLSRYRKGNFKHGISSSTHDPFPASYEELRSNFNAFGLMLANGFIKMAGLQQSMRNVAQKIALISAELAERVDAQKNALAYSTSSLSVLTKNVKAMADSAVSVEVASRANHANAESGTKIVREAIEAMRGIEQSSSQITRIIGVIDDIAFQTNLLALNAGVEAARAGEAGRGFAVVASEVRGLAQRASESAKEIKMLISKSGIQVTEGVTLVNQAGESLAQILEKAAEVSAQITAIARNASEQSSGLADINATISQLDQVSQENANSSKEVQTLTKDLHEKLDLLQQELTVFGVKKEAPIPAVTVKGSSQSLPKKPLKSLAAPSATRQTSPPLRQPAPRRPAAAGPNKFIEF